MRSAEINLSLDVGYEVYQAQVAGTLAGSGMHPQPAGYSTTLIATDDKGRQAGYATIDTSFGTQPPSSAFVMSVAWPKSDGASAAFTIHALQVKGSDSNEEDFTGYGSLSVSLGPDTTLTNQTLMLSAVESRQVTIDAAAPAPGWTVDSATAYYRLAPGNPIFDNWSNKPSSKIFSLLLPSSPYQIFG